ncbi:flagellin [Exiguobacterium sp. MER 193]|uniref:flagellin N-terminal helical domain-containing protein n=1 Tax=Exiguobacterium sp. MER 193 TaxID=2939564 RepID=UPI002559FF2D|nr:flagellin [Exiguobacterium sp. MER 193]
MIINHNLNAMNAHRNMGANTVQTGKAMEKLSSGLRINRAGDDAAGLAISEKMRGQIRGLDQATRNAQDGISMIQTAEGALNETHSILQRMRELAVQAGNDTNTTTDRKEIQKEINQLTSEINRIGNATEFNEQKLLNGDRSATSVVSKAEIIPGTKVDVTKAVTQTIAVGAEPISWSDSASATKFDIAVAGTANNGLAWNNLDAAATNEVKITRSAANTFTVDISATDDAAGTPQSLTVDADAMAFDPASGTYSYNNQGVSFSFKAEDAAQWKVGASVTLNLNTADADADATNGINATGAHTSLAVKIPLTTGGTDTAGAAAVPPTNAVVASTMTSVTVDGTSPLVLAGADSIDIAWNEATSKFTATVKAGATELSKTEFSLASGETLKYEADGIKFDFTAGSTPTDDNNGTASASFALKTATTSVETKAEVVKPEVTVDKSAIFQIGANQNQSLSLSISDMRSSALGLTTAGTNADFGVTNGTDSTISEQALDVTSSAKAAEAVTKISNAIETVSGERSKLGAVQNRLEHTINNLSTSSENLQAAESRIRDVDMAKEMMNFTKNNILNQAAQAMLSQANQQPQAVLQLLR